MKNGRAATVTQRLYKALAVCVLAEQGSVLTERHRIHRYPDGDQKPDIDYKGITPHMAAADVVFNPVDTLFLKEAEKQGATAVFLFFCDISQFLSFVFVIYY